MQVWRRWGMFHLCDVRLWESWCSWSTCLISDVSWSCKVNKLRCSQDSKMTTRCFYTQVISVDPRRMKLAYKAGVASTTVSQSGLADALLSWRFHPSNLAQNHRRHRRRRRWLSSPQCSEIPQIQPLHHTRWRLSLLSSTKQQQQQHRHSMQYHADRQTDRELRRWRDIGLAAL